MDRDFFNSLIWFYELFTPPRVPNDRDERAYLMSPGKLVTAIFKKPMVLQHLFISDKNPVVRKLTTGSFL
jgi:hypothetical protein